MSNKLRYYKSDNVSFVPVVIMQDENKYINLNKQGFTETYLTIKDAIRSLSSNEKMQKMLSVFDDEANIVLSMVKETVIIDDNQFLGNGDPKNIFHYCKSATIFLTKKFKPNIVRFVFANLPEDCDFAFADYFGEDNSVRFGSGAIDAYKYFSEDCPNKELSEYILKNHMNFGISW